MHKHDIHNLPYGDYIHMTN